MILAGHPRPARGLAAHSRQHASSRPNRDLQKLTVPQITTAARSAESSYQLSPGVTRPHNSRQSPSRWQATGGSGWPLATRGPYRYLRHPNYALVIAEIAVLPLAFGALAIALVAMLLFSKLVNLKFGEAVASARERESVTYDY